jgi:type III restriction enzyme
MTTPAKAPIQPVEKPIICSPYDEPNDHWVYDTETGAASHAGTRRPASYWYKTERTGSAQRSLPGMAEEERDDLPLVNLLRADVRRWREAKYRGASPVTKELLNWWANPKRGRRLFFCQREAVETIIYLAELRIPGHSSRTKFKSFELSDENLALMLKGEKPRLANLTNPNFWPTLVDKPLDASLTPLRRLGCKMATGSGKTVVMSMLIAWAFCNRGVNPQSTEFPSAVLVCCPNLTVKERLQVLRPENPDNYYAAFDLVPVNLRRHLQAGKVLVENWHRFAPESEHKEGDKTYAVVDKGPETPETIARRVLGDLFDRLPIMVLNDEGHHCWRPAPPKEEPAPEAASRKGRKPKPTGEEDAFAVTDEEQAEARVWLAGLDQLNNCLGAAKRGISFCVDLSATPYYLKGSGFAEGQPFPWLVSDFGLVDAIESGIVKIPRLPVSDTAGKKDEVGRPDPKYFRLWHNIVAALKPHEKHGSGKPKAEPCYREAEGALKQLAGQWLEKFEYYRDATPDQECIPPVLIVVCDNTDIADYFYRKISGESESDLVTLEDVEDVEAGEDEHEPAEKKGKAKKQTVFGASAILPEFANTSTRKVTVRIDTELLAKAESSDPSKGKKQAGEELRRIIATVGRRGEPGEHVRCVVSVAMLTEGWDACNVTHILGIRAFGSQLLCEQVVGRGLRRMNYEPDPNTGLLTEENVDVYGIPFSVIPFRGRAENQKAPEDKPKHRVWAIPDRAELEIRVPIVDGYVFQLTKGLLRCDVDKVESLKIDAKLEPTATFLQPTAGYMDTHKQGVVPFQFVKQDRNAYYAATHLQSILFQIAQKIIDDLLAPSAASDDKKSRVMRLQSRHQLFPQVISFVQGYVAKRVDFSGVDARELGLEKYTTLVVERLLDAIHPDDSAGEPPLLPILDSYRPIAKTGNVDFPTNRPVTQTTKSHINLVVQHSDWEAQAAVAMDACSSVKCYARNDHLGLVIPYEYLEDERSYEPDFIVRLVNDLQLLLEIKGYEVHNPGLNEAKHGAAKRWVTAVNNLKEFGRWEFLVCRNLAELQLHLETLARGNSPPKASP